MTQFFASLFTAGRLIIVCFHLIFTISLRQMFQSSHLLLSYHSIVFPCHLSCAYKI